MTLEHKVALDPFEHRSGISIHQTAGGGAQKATSLPLPWRPGVRMLSWSWLSD